jgi:hypothetical protein
VSRTSDRKYLKNRKRIRHLDTCWLCGEWIDPELKSPHPMSWSADHVVPYAQTRDNTTELQPAHRLCNMKRRTKTPQVVRHGRQW